MDRYAALDRLAARARRIAMIPAATAQFAPWRELAEQWARVAVHGSDADLHRLLLDPATTRAPGRLLRDASPAPIATALENAMAPALLSAATARPKPPPRLRRPSATLSASKKCGGSYIPDWKE